MHAELVRIRERGYAVDDQENELGVNCVAVPAYLTSTPSTLDTRDLALRDVTAVGILGGSAGLAGTIAAYAEGSVDARPLVAATVGLAETADVLAGHRPSDAGRGPKIHIDPRL